jgi:arylsulfatase A
MGAFKNLLVLFSFSIFAQAEKAQPNFVIFLCDDLGWGDLACYGHPVIKTPNLDKFAKQGTKFTQCYSACAVCSPSRSSILTGRTPYRNGVWRWIPSGHRVHLRESEITLAELLKGKGYETCHVGKWHLNGKFNNPEQPQPSEHGFDHWMATQNNASPNHKNPRNFVRNGKAVGPLEGFSAPLVVEEGIRWLKDKRDPEKPFFLNVWTHEPHLPIESSPEFMKPYAEIGDEGIRQHHGNVTQIDHAFGNLMKALDEMGLSENTFVFFTSDNGPEGNGLKGRTRGSTGGLRERKRSSHEGGIRVPGIARWPGKVPAGVENRTPIIGSDLFSSILGIVKIPLPDDRTIDGTDFIPLFSGKKIERKVPLYWRNHLARSEIHVALREGDWKILANTSLDRFQLYNIEKDWKEEHEVSEKFPDKLEVLKKKLLAVHKQVEREGPREWWENEPARKPRKKKPKSLKKTK